MRKCRIIVADSDINYLLPLQLRFVEEFGDDVDLEIISDRAYFTKLFSTPQEVDILIVSEDLYDSSLQRHFVEHLFLMTEQDVEENTGNLQINQLYKYTSIKEIFSEITGVAEDVLAGQSKVKAEPKILLVTSASGGTGKTTVALGMCEMLAKNYKKVLYINAERLQVFQHRMENQNCVNSISKAQLASENVYKEIRTEIRKEEFSYLPAFRAPLLSLGLSYDVFKRIAVSAKQSGEYDFVVVDTDYVFDEHKLALMDVSDRVIIVFKPSASAMAAVNQLAANINNVRSEKYLFVCNEYEKENGMTSPLAPVRFTIGEYIEPIRDCEQIRISELSKSRGIQRVTLLVT